MALAIFVVGLAALCGWIYFGREPPASHVTLKSPNAEISVQLDEKLDRYYLPIHFNQRRFPTQLRFSAKAGDEVLAKDELLDDDPSNDIRYLDLGQSRWVSDHAIDFGSDQLMPDRARDEVIVTNDAKQPVAYFLLEAGQAFLILNFQPGASVKLQALIQYSLAYIQGGGRFRDGRKIAFYGMNFHHDDDRKPHVTQHYSVSIRDEGLLIKSSEVAGNP